MKQKIVIKVQMSCKKCRKEAMKIAASAEGVISVKLQGTYEKDQIEVIGNEVDSAGLCTTLRKKVGHSILLSIEEVKDPKPEEKKKKEDEKKPAEEKKSEEKKADNDTKEKEEKKQENGNNSKGEKQKKKEEETKKHECHCNCTSPGMYYQHPCHRCQPTPQYYCPTNNNPQYYICDVNTDGGNPGCNIM